jgi:hypothetical protein
LPECAAPVVSGWWASRGGDKPGTAAVWLALARVKTACVWVTDPSPAGLSRTLEAMTAAEKCGLPMRQFVVAVNDSRGHGWASRSRSRRTLLAGFHRSRCRVSSGTKDVLACRFPCTSCLS